MSLEETAAFKAAAYSSSATAPSRDSSTSVSLPCYGVSPRCCGSENRVTRAGLVEAATPGAAATALLHEDHTLQEERPDRLVRMLQTWSEGLG